MGVDQLLRQGPNVKDFNTQIEAPPGFRFDPYSYFNEEGLRIIREESLPEQFKGLRPYAVTNIVLGGYLLFPESLPRNNRSWENLKSDLANQSRRHRLSADGTLDYLVMGKLVFDKKPWEFGNLINNRDIVMLRINYLKDSRNRRLLLEPLGRHVVFNEIAFPGSYDDRQIILSGVTSERGFDFEKELRSLDYEMLAFFRLAYPEEFKRHDIRDRDFWEKADKYLKSKLQLEPKARAQHLLIECAFLSIIAADEVKIENGRIILINNPEKQEVNVPPMPEERSF